MFRDGTDEDAAYVPNKIVSLFPESRVDYGPQNQMVCRWLIPQYLGFIDPSQLSLRYKAYMVGRGWNRPSACGVHAFTRDIRVMTGDGKTELEQISDYNVLEAQTQRWTENTPIGHKRDLFEGRSNNPGINNQLWHGPAVEWRARLQANAIVENNPNPTLQIQQPLNTGILGSSQVFPVGATQGLRVQQTFESVVRATDNSTSVHGMDDTTVKMSNIIDGTAGGFTKAAADSLFVVTILSGVEPANSVKPDDNPFCIGDVLTWVGTIATATDPTKVEYVDLGIIRELYKDAGSNAMSIGVCGNWPIGAAPGLLPTVITASGDVIQYNLGKRFETITYTAANQGKYADTEIGCTYVLSELEMSVATVQPPDSYIQNMQKQLQGGGLVMDYQTTTMYRTNLQGTHGLSSQLIPADQRRAFSVLSVPYPHDGTTDATDNSFNVLPDGALSYQYTHGGQLIPDRVVPLARLSLDPPRAEQLHLMECEKAISNISLSVKNLTRSERRFMVARAFSRYKQVYDLSSASLTLRMEYSNAAILQKVFDHFVVHLRRLVVTNSGSTVES